VMSPLGRVGSPLASGMGTGSGTNLSPGSMAALQRRSSSSLSHRCEGGRDGSTGLDSTATTWLALQCQLNPKQICIANDGGVTSILTQLCTTLAGPSPTEFHTVANATTAFFTLPTCSQGCAASVCRLLLPGALHNTCTTALHAGSCVMLPVVPSSRHTCPACSLLFRLLRHSAASPLDLTDLQRSGSQALNVEQLESGDVIVDITPPTRVTQV
jgi:hypothetical protein